MYPSSIEDSTLLVLVLQVLHNPHPRQRGGSNPLLPCLTTQRGKRLGVKPDVDAGGEVCSKTSVDRAKLVLIVSQVVGFKPCRFLFAIGKVGDTAWAVLLLSLSFWRNDGPPTFSR